MVHAVLVVDSNDGQLYDKGQYVLTYNSFTLLKQLWRLLICESHSSCRSYGLAVWLRGMR